MLLFFLAFSGAIVHFRGSDSVHWARRFMFEAMCIEIDGCTETIVQTWGEEQGDVVTKIKACQHSLLCWNKSKVGHISMQIRWIQG